MFPILHGDRDGTGMTRGRPGDNINFLGMPGQDRDVGGLLWGHIGDGGDLHVRPHHPKLKNNIKKRKEENQPKN